MNELDDYKIFLDYFKGREDYFASQGKENYHPIPKKLTIDYLIKHVQQLATFGIYVLTSDSKCNFMCIDIDIPKHELEAVYFRNLKEKYDYLKNKLGEILELLEKEFNIGKEEVLIEDTGGRGFHIWLFFSKPIDGADAVKFYNILKLFIKFDFEFFPKQGRLSEKTKLGNLIKLPLGIHQKYEAASSFCQIINGEIKKHGEIEENLSYLCKIKKITPRKFQNIIDGYPEAIRTDKIGDVGYEKYIQEERSLYKKDIGFLFSHCEALNRLKEKAEKGIQLSYNEAFHFTNLVLSIDNSEDFLIKILKKSFGDKYRPAITQKEIESIRPLYPSSCLKLINQEICKGYCNDEIRKRNEDNLLPNTNPVAFWLTKIEIPEIIKKKDILIQIADPRNIINAYWKLKKYHRDEDVGAYDEFDFEHFEKNLEINSRYMSRALETKQDIPFIGYLKINLPKKLDEENKMQFRQMSYSTVYDQVVIQAIFNIVAKLLERNFSDCSYGYRCNAENITSDEIFFDWREYYPKFRNKVLGNLRQQNIRYYICCDIKGFYDNVQHDLLIEQIRGHVDNKDILTMMEKIIGMYHFRDGSNTGLPQGPAYARILANMYLNNFDGEILSFSAGFVRYVDDFFLFYESREQAEKGLKKVYELLRDIGLTLSDDENKKPEILESTDEAKIITKLDSIRYGMFEESKYIDYLDRPQIEKFYDAIVRHLHISTTNYDEILEINSKLPSILYVLSKKREIYHSIASKIPAIVNYLVENNLFYPKRLKYIFFKLIDLMVQHGHDICKLYEKLDKAHKVHFLLTLYKKNEREGKYKQELLNVLRQSIEDSDFYVNGFGIAINNKLDDADKLDVNSEEYLNKILSSPIYFSKLKLLNTVDYFRLSEEKKAIVRRYISSDSLYIEKKYLLSNTQPLNVDYIDSTFFSNLLASNSFFLATDCCNILSSLRDNTSLFRIIEKHVSSIPNYKQVIIYYLTSLIYERYKNSTSNELNNIIELYEEIKDEEIKREVINVIKRIQNSSDSSEGEFKKNHRLIVRYNQCSYYKNDKTEDREYDFIEIIPEFQLSAYDYQDLESLRKSIINMSYGSIMPNLDFQFDSSKGEVLLKYSKIGEFEELKDNVFGLNNESILLALQLMDDLYKKSRYFFQRFRKVPLISKDNLIINFTKKKIQFKNFGSILCPSYFLDNQIFNNNDKLIIPIMISCLLKDLFFLNDQEKVKKFQSKPSVGMELALSHFIGRLGSKKTYSYPRFSYIVQKLSSLDTNSTFDVSSSYYRERLKSLLFDKNDTINWLNICSALNDLYSEFAKTYGEIDFKKIDFENKITFNRDLPRNLHYLSRMILNLSLNANNLLKCQNVPRDFLNMIELLNYYSIFCIEAMSFYKVSINGTAKKMAVSLLEDEMKLKANDYVQSYTSRDIDIIKALIRKDIAGKNIFEQTNIFTLKQVSFFYLLRTFESEINGATIEIKGNGNSLKAEDFDSLVFNLLVRLPQIEDEVAMQISHLLDALRTNLDYHIQDEKVLKLKSDILVFCKDMNKIRKAMEYRRCYGFVKTDKWPVALYCRNLFLKENKATIRTLDKIPLTNLYPSSKSKCSWDMLGHTVENLVIPNERINLLISKLKKGKLLGYKIAWLYSEKSKLIWDLCLILISFTLLAFFHKYADNSIKNVFVSICWLGRYILAVVIFTLLGKAIFMDAKYWFKGYEKIVEYIRK